MDNLCYEMYKIMGVLKHVNFAGIVVHARDDRYRPACFSVRFASEKVRRLRQGGLADMTLSIDREG
jgi:hypothetical protein